MKHSRRKIFQLTSKSLVVLLFLVFVAGIFICVPNASLAVNHRQEKKAGEEGEKKTPLDLPKDLPPSTGGAAETISLYGSNFNSQCFVFCVDISTSMKGTRWEGVKAELLSLLDLLTPSTEIGIVLYGTESLQFCPRGISATDDNVALAKKWLEAQTPGGFCGMGDALVKALNICDLSEKRKCSVILIGDGLPEVKNSGESLLTETMENIMEANNKKHAIHAIFLKGESSSREGSAFFKQIAERNHGKFTLTE